MRESLAAIAEPRPLEPSLMPAHVLASVKRPPAPLPARGATDGREKRTGMMRGLPDRLSAWLSPYGLCAFGLAVALAWVVLFQRAETLREREELTGGALSEVVDAVGMQAAIAKDVALSAIQVVDAPVPAAARSALERGIARQNRALENLVGWSSPASET